MNNRKGKEARQLIEKLVSVLHELSDSELTELINNKAFDDLLKGILDPSTVSNFKNYAEFFDANKIRSTLIASLRRVITKNYSFKVERGLHSSYVSPCFTQWFEDGILFLEGDKPFEGMLGLFRNKELKYGIMARDKRPGEEIGPDDFKFISVGEANELLSKHILDLEKPISELTELLDDHEEDESHYQEYFKNYPWVLGIKYRHIQSHRRLNDKNIPDFTGVRVSDGFRDIIEIKSPFITVFTMKGELASAFNKAWNQVVRYLNYARENRDTLRREKGLNFDNPRGYIIIGFNISDRQLKKIRNKEKLTPAIEVLTYNDVLAYTQHTIELVKSMKSIRTSEENACCSDK